jgi:hypothetical protein
VRLGASSARRPKVNRGPGAVASDIVHRFILDLARLGYGEAVDLEAYVEPATAALIRESYAGYGNAGYSIEADYGDACAASAHLDDATSTARVELELEDRSVARWADGSRAPLEPSRWHITLLVDAVRRRIDALEVERA